MFITLIIAIFCCMFYFVSILFSEGEQEPLSDIVDYEIDVSAVPNIPTGSNLEYKEKTFKSWSEKNILINDNKDSFKKYDFFYKLSGCSRSDNKILNEVIQSMKKIEDVNSSLLPIASHSHDFEIEKQYNNLKVETLKVNQELSVLQYRLNSLFKGKQSEEFNKLPSDIKNLAQENISEETLYLLKKKNE